MSVKEEDQKDAGVPESFKVGDIVRIVSGEYLGELGKVTWVSNIANTVTLEIADRLRGEDRITKFQFHVKHVFKTDRPKRLDSAIIRDIRKLLDELES